MFPQSYFAATYYTPNYWPPGTIVIQRVEGDPWGAWENFSFYRRKFLERYEREKQLEYPIPAEITAETRTEEITVAQLELSQSVSELQELLDESQAQIDEIRALGRSEELDSLDTRIRELEEAVRLGKLLRRRFRDEQAVVTAIITIFWGGQ